MRPPMPEVILPYESQVQVRIPSPIAVNLALANRPQPLAGLGAT